MKKHLTQASEQQELCELFARHGLIGPSQALVEVFRRASRASQFNDLPVLLLGETGTGKQRLAEAIHAIDPRRQSKPFFSLDCSAISKHLAESKLFGHSRGAFSGATGDRLGIFRAAHGGTLLLDEIGELDLELQPKLLRVLQENCVVPVGEDYEHPVDVRIIAATNRPLRQMVAQGKFREDLFQRLNVFQIRIPPLRERPEDIDAQAHYFLSRYAQDRCSAVTALEGRLLQALRALPLEGNSRQLENLIREMLACKEHGSSLEVEDLPPRVLDTLADAAGPSPAPDASPSQPLALTGVSFTAAVEEFERRLLQSTLARFGGNRTRTAAALGLSPRSIFNKIKKHRLV